MEWDNKKRALITGASSGIGKGFAKKLAEQGFNVILIARRKDRLEKLSAELKEKHNIEASVLTADLSKISDIENVVSYIKTKGDVECLVNSAGYAIWRSFLGIELKQHFDFINVNFTAPIVFCHAVLPKMIERKRGIIINISSSGVIDRKPGVTYFTTKSGLVSFSEKLHEKMYKKGILVQSLLPGLTITEMHDEQIAQGKFKREWFPKEAWMSVEDLVSFSFKALDANPYTPLVVPGEYNTKELIKLRKEHSDDYINLRIFS
ncbi:MAG: SDR family NAD(P)-dependent oxidoreductase [Promethearchaeota archaeon]